MRKRIDDFDDAVIVVVTFDAPSPIANALRERLAPFTVLVDETRATYKAYGLGRGTIRRVWGPKIWRRYSQLLRAGARFHIPRADTLQLGGDFVIDRSARIVFAHRSTDPDDRPNVDALIAAVRGV